MLSQDLLNASLQIPFSVPPYMSLLARAVATLEGIALSGNPDYQMIAEVWPISCALHPVPTRLVAVLFTLSLIGTVSISLLNVLMMLVLTPRHGVAATSRPVSKLFRCNREAALKPLCPRAGISLCGA